MMKQKKKALVAATIYGFINSFESNELRVLQENGYEVHCLANPFNTSAGVNSNTDKIDGLGGIYKHKWSISRSPLSKENIRAFKEIKSLLYSEHFNLIHCHTPMGGVIARLAAKKYRHNGTKVIYTAHGFHFFEGAPLRNWLIYYPIEWFLSFCTDVLITINKEDYKRAQKHFHAKKVVYVPGVGVDISKFSTSLLTASEREELRKEIGVEAGQILLLSVGELNENKNHKVVIRAIAELSSEQKSRVVYIIAGAGGKKNELEKLAVELGIAEHVHFLGYRSDVAKLYDTADIYILPSLREGLNVSLMEAMASSLPCIAGKIRGNIDLVDENGGSLFASSSVESCRSSLERLIMNGNEVRSKMGKYNRKKIQDFSKEVVGKRITSVYRLAK